MSFIFKKSKFMWLLPLVAQLQDAQYLPESLGKASILKSRISTEVPIIQIIWSI